MLAVKTSRSTLTIAVAVVFCLALFLYTHPFPTSHSTSNPNNTPQWTTPPSKHAFATFLSTHSTSPTDDDPYFTATRVLAYQLLHQPHTRSAQNTPLLVLVPPHVPEAKRSILRAEGATIIPVETIMPSTWEAYPSQERWIDQFTKLHLFNLTQYERILFMDNDMLLTRPLDSIWEEESVRTPRETLPENIPNLDEGMRDLELPSTYVLAGATDNEGPGSTRPTPILPNSRLNGGFLVLKPDEDLYNYYLAMLNCPDIIFERAFMEMGLLNSAHRSDGPMPWAPLPAGRYTNNWPSWGDVEAGSATLHDKFWANENEEWIDRELVEMWWRTQGKMEGYWQRDGEM